MNDDYDNEMSSSYEPILWLALILMAGLLTYQFFEIRHLREYLELCH